MSARPKPEPAAVLQRRITVALELHAPVMNPQQGVMCRVCRDPYPCDTAIALGARQ